MIGSIVATEGVSFLVILTLLYGSLFEMRQKNKRHQAYIHMVVITLISNTADLFSWIPEGNEHYTILMSVLSVISMIGPVVMELSFLRYLFIMAEERGKRVKNYTGWIHIAALLCVLSVLLLTLSGKLFHYENGVYMDGPAYGIYLFENLMIVIIVLISIVAMARVMGRHDVVAMLSYIFLPGIAMLQNIIYPAYSFVYPTFAVSILIIYIMIQSERENDLLKREMSVEKQANQDELTGLLNRRAFTQYCGSQVGPGKAGVIFCDVNGLKYTNDHFGHKMGDELICKSAYLLVSGFRKASVFRISGDEFVVILPEIPQNVFEQRIADLRKRIAEFDIPPLSVGSAFGDKSEVYRMIEQAEQDMYLEKKIFHERFPDRRRG